jgi:transcriptional regulator with XRE-family HTH domain
MTLSAMTEKEKQKTLLKFASHLNKLRDEQGISIRELASRSALEYSQVQRILKGKVNLSLTTIVSLADGLNLPQSDLLNY